MSSVQREGMPLLRGVGIANGQVGLDRVPFGTRAASRGAGCPGSCPSLPADASRFLFSTGATEVPRLPGECIAPASAGL